ncbi:hypothetical protein [Tropicimonas sp. IMCC6043]|uniref:hypothetical protein n=1 Tax=Tropicimonas sp. IMCC6043 TaxID=2510645 RepID=UPI00101DD068|nr:hypothetical protein [Tropicimonas sp. IMCC6043]RYH08406.1 hypothetical protein EU800_16385 [Tropicimonas sp. IMCC6043]
MTQNLLNCLPTPEITPGETLATITPSAARRITGVAALAALGAVLIYVALVSPPAALFWQGFLLLLGVGTLYLADMLRRATAQRLVLTPEALRESGGRLVARVEDIVAVERGAFAIKPSNGFLLRLRVAQAGGSRWAPGLWWRLGRRVGVGGITSAAEGKAMAEILSTLILMRQGQVSDGSTPPQA